MEEQEIIKNTRLIAEFMDYNVIQYKGKPTYNGNKYAKTVGEQENLWGGLNLEFTGRFTESVKYPFHTDFNYLLPIIRRIEEQGYVVAIAGISYKVYRKLEEKNPIVSWVCGDVSKKTELVYILLISFIEWYNNQNKKDIS